MKARRTILSLLLILVGMGVWADEETLTVYEDGADQTYFTPFSASSAANGTRSQFIIPADQLTAMNECEISSLTFYANKESVSFDEGFTIYLKEVDYDKFSSSIFEDWSSMTAVYTGTIGISNSQMVIKFDTPYTYNGGNLMIGFYVTTWGNSYSYVKWDGFKSSTLTAIYNDADSEHNWKSTNSPSYFIPKTTFTYEAPNASCPKPSNLTASVTNGRTATVTWESEFTSFNLRYKVSSEENWTEVNNLTAKSYTFTTLSPETSYQVQIQAIGNNETSKWASVSFTTPLSIPAPTDLTCTASTSTYATLAWTKNGDEAYWQICLDGDETNLITVSQNPYMLTKVTAGHTYTAKVRAVTSTGDEYSAWSNVVTFTAIDELTVYDGTATSSNVPMYVYSFSSCTRSQYVIPAEELTAMVDNNITSIKFYLQPSISHSTLYTTSYTFDIYLKEVENTSISAFVDKAAATVVYSGTVDFPTDNVVTINFTTPFEYNGGNLLIGCENTPKDANEYASYYYYGETVDGASIYAASSTEANLKWVSQANFIPKTTFIYNKPTTLVRIPTNFEAKKITPHSAKLKWKSNFDRFNLRYKISTDEEWTEVNSLLAKSYELTDLRSSTKYDAQVQTIGVSEISDWVSTSFTTTAMPAPRLLFCMTTTANTATLSWLKDGDETAWEICLNGDEDHLVNATTIPYTVTGLANGQEYTAKVRAAKGTDHSVWSDAVTFTIEDLQALTPPVIEGYEGVYDGEPHSFRVVSSPNDATLRFGYGPNTCDRTAAQMGYRINAGSYPYYWQLSKDGYATLTGCVQVIIHKAKGTMKFEETIVDRFSDDDPFTNPLTFTGDGTVTFTSHNPDAATVDPSTGEVTINGIGWTEITATATDGTNYYYDPEEVSYGLAMTKKRADSYKQRIVVWLKDGLLTDLTFDSEPEFIYDESTGLVSITNTPYTWLLVDMKKLTFTSSLPTFTFNEEDENDDAVDDKNGYFCNFTLDRTFRKGGYNSFAVPFSISLEGLREVMGDETVVKELKSSTFSNGSLSMIFENATEIVAGKPYLITVPEDVVNPTFMEVTVRNGSTPTKTDYVNVIPAIGKTLVVGAEGYENNTQSVLFLGGGNKFFHPTVINRPADEDSYLKGFRVYFQLHNGASLARNFYDNLDDAVTDINQITVEKRYEDDSWYTLDGQRLSGRPTQKGIYIRNGKKIVVK